MDEVIQGGKLNGGLGDFRLLRDDGLLGRGPLAQDLHAEGHSGRGHGIDAFCRLLGHAQIGARCSERFLRDPGLDAQFGRATGDVRQRPHISCDDAVLLR